MLHMTTKVYRHFIPRVRIFGGQRFALLQKALCACAECWQLLAPRHAAAGALAKCHTTRAFKHKLRAAMATFIILRNILMFLYLQERAQAMEAACACVAQVLCHLISLRLFD